ncbi:MAG: TIGR00295 family protein [Candidatus Korarchaeota archaeon]|nr:TIGR00295 family protein [Candidatus Korarchaeota archaeon]NIU85559.1 TIGR00295 family protein [Candidatus Thorarchaeota archaeon]
MTRKLPSRTEALRFLRETRCSQSVIDHCKSVAELAVEIAKALKRNGLSIDLQLVEIGSLLHDIGRAETHSVHHAVAGARIAKSLGLPESLVSIIRRHVGGGITSKTAKQLGWPDDIYVPQTLEEKIVSYADKLIEGDQRVPIERTIEKFRINGLPPSAIRRLRRMNEEMTALIGDCECQP